LIDLFQNIKLLRPGLLEKDPFPEHENANLIPFFYPDIGHSHGIINRLSIIGGNDEQHFHAFFPFLGYFPLPFPWLTETGHSYPIGVFDPSGFRSMKSGKSEGLFGF
jgi:hypothetical protein